MSEERRVFVIEVYEDWADYPSWVELDLDNYDGEDPAQADEEGTMRFDSPEEAREWLDAFLDRQDEKSWARWVKHEAEVDDAEKKHILRVALLAEHDLLEPGVGEYRHSGTVLHGPKSRYKKPAGVDRTKYRVMLEDYQKCPTCGRASND